MDTNSDDELLKTLADGKSIDLALWPALLTRLIPRLKRVASEFPPLPPQSQSLAVSQPRASSNSPSQEDTTLPDSTSPASTQSADKENAPPPAAMPAHIVPVLTSITSTLTNLFSKYPPHTIQRLAELILNPRQHHRTLPSYLHAVDRVVHVTSGSHIFPLPTTVPDISTLTNGLATSADPLSVSWGNSTNIQASGLGSDEALGGALLTPISWLSGTRSGTHSPLEGEVRTESTETIDGPNGPGGVETVSVFMNGVGSAITSSTTESLRAEGGVTQGELLRQEQRAGVVPAAQLAGQRLDPEAGIAEDEEIPHARGPEEIGMEDMGPQGKSNSERITQGVAMQGIDVEAAVGRRIYDDDEVNDDEEGADTATGADGDGAGTEDAEKGKGVERNNEMTVRRSSTPKREADEDLGNGEMKRIKMDEDMSDVDDHASAALGETDSEMGDKGTTDLSAEKTAANEQDQVVEEGVEGKDPLATTTTPIEEN